MRGLVTLACVAVAALLSAGASSVARADESPPSGPPPSGPPPSGEPPLGQPPSGQPPSGQPPSGQPPSPDVAEDPTLRKVVSERRAGVVIGVAPGIGFAGASGYPNNARLVGNGDFYSESPMLVGTSTTYFLMGALTDYVSFGPMVNIAKFESDSWKSTGLGIGFRVEAFPLVRLFPMLADGSIYGQAGVGSTELQLKGNYPSADGTQSFAGIGLHHEFRLFRMLGGHVSGGPYVEYDAIFAKSAERHWASVGFRIAWYGGSVPADKR